MCILMKLVFGPATTYTSFTSVIKNDQYIIQDLKEKMPVVTKKFIMPIAIHSTM